MSESEKLINNETEAIECLKSNKPTSGYVMLRESIDMAIQALEKQIPKKVVKDGKWSYRCPCCDECAETDCGDTFYDYQLDYCNGCGQKLDWSDEE